jgi:hypothetical protein
VRKVKLGAENRTKLIAAGALGAVALILLVTNFFGGSTPTPSSPAPVAAATPAITASAPQTSAISKRRGKKAPAGPRSLDPTLRYDWLKASEDTKYEGNGRNIFMAQAEIPTPVAPVKTPDEIARENAPPPPPPPPPINLKFFGFASKPGEPKKIFLSEGEDVFIASEGDVVDRHYKVLHISPAAVEIEDVLNNNRQSIPLTAG